MSTKPSLTDPVPKALWFIENHYERDLSLEEVAEAAGVSRYRLTRAFGAATGRPVIGYIRARRMTEAARRLAGGAPDILEVAIAAGYGSHEAFTRAFRDLFGVTPEQVRARGRLDDLTLVEPKLMDGTPDGLSPPRVVDSPALLLAGLSETYAENQIDGIPRQWQRFSPYIGTLPTETHGVYYGVSSGIPGVKGQFRYMTGVEVADASELPRELITLKLPAQTYAVFEHKGHLSSLRRTVHAVFSQWLPSSGYRHGGEPQLLEWYGPKFDPSTNGGGLEVWIPVTRQD